MDARLNARFGPVSPIGRHAGSSHALLSWEREGWRGSRRWLAYAAGPKLSRILSVLAEK